MDSQRNVAYIKNKKTQ